MNCCDNAEPHIHTTMPLIVLSWIMVMVMVACTAVTALASHLEQASWYDDGPGYYGAVHSYRWGDPRYTVRVCRIADPDRCVLVTVRDHMANAHREIDLSPDAFSRLAPLSRGVVDVTVRRVDLPPTDTEGETWQVSSWNDQMRVVFWAAVAAAYVTVRQMLKRRLR